MKKVMLASEALRSGGFVLIHDGKHREDETDIVVASQFVNYESIRFMRKHGGGLICVTIPKEHADLLRLPYLHEIFYSSDYEIFKYLRRDVKYDAAPAFSITINHVDTYTGISDRERAKTINEFARFIENMDKYANPLEEFGKRFISPGHVHVLIASDIRKRHGHTELSTYLVKMAGLIPSATIVEMLGDDGYSLSKEEAQIFADEMGIPFLEGKEILDAWLKWSE